MKKHTLILLTFLLCTALLAGCSCQHQWTDATCTVPKTCSKCGISEGDSPGHSWQDADCVTPRSCSRCTLTEGSPLGHSWAEATCTSPKTCTRCCLTEGLPLDHIWEGEATLYSAPFCAVCDTRGEPLPSYFLQNGLVPNTQPQTSADHITGTLVRPDLDTTGSFHASEVQIFEADDTHRAKKGYEWRSVEISITFSDTRSALYGTNVSCVRADYYQDQELKPANKQERFTVTYHGKEYKCLAIYEKGSFYYDDGSSEFYLTCYVQVPEGYDGVVLAFPHSSIAINGMHLQEVEDANMLLFRLA